MKKNALNWFEIASTDFERAVKFYETIFAFSMTRMDLGDGPRMALFPVDPSQGVGGAVCHHPDWYKPSKEGTLVYLAADPDLAPILARVHDAGGKVLVPKKQISPEYGYMAVFLDSEGNRVALHSEN
jgi:predicted enzyme related to lactoylglutathione lyase